MVLIARLYYRHPVTREMMPISLGGSAGGNEVSVQSTAPTDGTELWMDTTSSKLKYRDQISGDYVDVPVGSAGGGGTDGIIQAGAGLTGGGAQSTNPVLNVGQGWAIWVDNDMVHVNPGTLDQRYQPIPGHNGTLITDWNQAVLVNTCYRGNNASNGPDTGWFFGYTFSHDANYKHQLLFPYANARWHSGTMFEREQENGTWGDWNRVGTYLPSRDTLDAGTFAQHNTSGSSLGVRRAFWGVVKDKATNSASNADAWRVTYYNTAGTYVGRAIDIPLGTGVVSMPQGHSVTSSAIQEGQPIPQDVAATVGVVVDIVIALMARAGITIDPTEVISLMEASE